MLNVHLRELTGEDQSFLMDEGIKLLPAGWVTEILTRCVTSLGDGLQVTRDAIRSLTAGEREAALLQLRRLLFDNRLPCVLTCPSPGCGEKLDLELNINDLLVSPSNQSSRWHELTIGGDDGATYTVRFRLPDGSDQEAAARLAQTDVDAAADLLLRRCVESIVPSNGLTEDVIPKTVADQISARMAELDPQAEILLQITCAACGHAFGAILDAASFVRQELEAGARHLYREVHLLAYHYHWSLSEILGMSGRTRRRYLDLLEEELAQEGVQ